MDKDDRDCLQEILVKPNISSNIDYTIKSLMVHETEITNTCIQKCPVNRQLGNP